MPPKGFSKKEEPTQVVPRDMGLLKAWSYSQWSDYEKCPAKVGYKKIHKVKEVEGDALARGIAIHSLAERCLLTGDLTHLAQPVPGKATKLSAWGEQFADLCEVNAKSEFAVALTREWKLTDWRASTAWMRGKLDSIVTDPNEPSHAVVIDFKSGRKYPDHIYQADLYATSALLLPENYETVEVQMWYVDNTPDKAAALSNFDGRTWKRVELQSYIAGWESRIEPMMNDTIFPHRPGQHCDWCGFSGRKGGVCPKG